MNYAPTNSAPNASVPDRIDYNDAAPQRSLGLIPEGTTAKVRMIIKPGGYNDPARQWTGGYATHNPDSGAVYLNCEFVVMEGPYATQRVWSLIGLQSSKGPEWSNMGQTFIRAILGSARGFAGKDKSPEAAAARRANFAELDGIEFTALIETEQDKGTKKKRNVIKRAVLKDDPDYPGESPATQGTNVVPYNTALPSWAR